MSSRHGRTSHGYSSSQAVVEDRYVKALRIRVENQERIRLLEPGEPYFDCVAACISFGLDLLESRRGRIALENNGRGIIAGARKRNSRVRARDPAYMEHHAATFLRSVRTNFPCVIIRFLNGMNARTTKGTWDQPPDRAFVAQHAAVIELNAFLVKNLSDYLSQWRDKPSSTERQARFQSLFFRLGLTMAHEIVHIFTSYLLYDRRAHTPSNVSYGPFGTDILGESGRAWEFGVFGGYITCRTDGNMEQIATVSERGRVKIFALPAIQFILQRDFESSWPFLDEEECPRNERPKTMEKYDWGRRYEDIFAPIGRLIEQYTPEYSAEFVDGLMKKGGWCHDANDTDCRKFAFNPHRGIRVLSLRMGVI